MTQAIDKDSLPLNKPRRTPNHPTKSHVVKTKVDGKEKIIRFGEQGAETAGKPKAGESERMKQKRASFKARHGANIAKGPSSAAYWANKVKWADGGSVETKGNGMAEARSIPQNAALGKLAELLNKAKDIGNKVDLPVIGGLGDLVVGETPSEVENWSYGNYPIQTTEMGLPQIKRERKQSLADTAFALGPMVRATKNLPVGLSIKQIKSPNLNENLIEKYLSTGNLSPEEMAQYETNALKMETPNLQKYNLENANLQGGTPESRAADLGYIDNWRHGRYSDYEQINPDKTLYATQDPDYASIYAIEPSASSMGGKGLVDYEGLKPNIMPLMIKESQILDTRLPQHSKIFNKDFYMKYGNATPLTDKKLPDWVEGEDFREMFEDVNPQFKGVFLDEGKIPTWEGGLKDRGVSAAIFDPSIIRSRFAAFDPLRKESSSLLAGTALGDLLLKYASQETSSPEKPDNYAQGGAVQYDPAKIDAIIAAIPRFSDDEIKTIMQSS